MNISLYQFDPVWEDKQKNQQKIRENLENSKLETDVLIFPEMTLTGFTMRSKRFSETNEGETVNFFESIASQYNTHIFAGFIEKIDDSFFNTLIHINRKGKLLNRYQKIHPFSFSGENRHYAGGNKPVVTEVDKKRIGLSICYDLRFPELYRQYGKNKVYAIINIANWPLQRIEHWRHLLKSRAIENLCYVVGINRVGKDKGNVYSGQSAVFGPLGETMLQAKDKENIESVKLDFKTVTNARERFPFLEDIKLI